MKEKHLDEKKTRKQTKQVKKKETRRNTGWNKYRWDACLVYSSFGVMLRILLTMEGFWRSPTFPIHYWCLCIFCLLIYCAFLFFLFCASQLSTSPRSPCPSKKVHTTRPSSDLVIPSNVDLVFISPNDGRLSFGVKHGWTQPWHHQHHRQIVSHADDPVNY